PQLIADAARKMVKVYGAGGTAGLEPYQTGILISPDGQILTAASTVLDGDAIDCVLDDGRRFAARLVGVDPRREVAVIDVEASDLPCFALAEAASLVPPGTRVVTLSNMFGVAAGDEPVTAQRGVVAAIVPLNARRGAADAPFRGLVYVLDRTTNNPGSPGGAIVDSRGRLLGMLGKELRSTAAGIWLNYALPAEELKRGLDEIVAGGAGDAADVGGKAFDTRKLGLVLVPDLLDRTPPFVESVDADSPAARAGLAADDLVIAVGSRSVTTRTAVEMALGGLADGDAVKLTVIRRGGLVEIDLGPRPGGD
ncbi:MAG: serine protease, partial [Planctomycetes bacterium]|nr:serine protease [Planctomycetota bacterium]